MAEEIHLLFFRFPYLAWNMRKNKTSKPWFLGCFWHSFPWSCYHMFIYIYREIPTILELSDIVFLPRFWSWVGVTSSMFLVWAPRGAPRSRIFSDYTWGGVGWGCVHVPSTCTRWWCTRHECYATHGVVWGGAVLCHECYGTHGVVWGGAVFTFLQLAHAGDAHAMNATLLRLDAGLLWDFTLGCIDWDVSWYDESTVYIYIYIYIHIDIYLHMYIYVYVYLHMYIYVYVYLYFSKNTYLDIYKYRCVSVGICI